MQFILPIISGAAALILALITYLFTKSRDRETEWRKLKLERYQEFIAALSEVVGARSNSKTQERFANATNALTLVAPRRVMTALYSFLDEIRHTNQNKTAQSHDAALNRVIEAIRADIHPGLLSGPPVAFRLMDVPKL